MFFNPTSGFRDPRDPFGLLQLAGANPVPEIAPRPVATSRVAPDGTPALGFPPSPTSPRLPEATTPVPVPDERSVPLPPTSRKVPEVVGLPGSPVDERLIPTAASQAPPPQTIGNYWDRIMALQKEGKLSPIISALAKGVGAGGGTVPIPKTHMPELNPIRGEPHRTDANAAQMMEKLLAGSPGKAKKSQRRQEQDRYDILGGRG